MRHESRNREAKGLTAAADDWRVPAHVWPLGDRGPDHSRVGAEEATWKLHMLRIVRILAGAIGALALLSALFAILTLALAPMKVLGKAT